MGSKTFPFTFHILSDESSARTYFASNGYNYKFKFGIKKFFSGIKNDNVLLQNWYVRKSICHEKNHINMFEYIY